MLTLYYLGEKLSGGVKIYPAAQKTIRWPDNYQGGRRWAKNQKNNENCRTVPKIPYSISLYIEPNYTLSLYIEPNYSLSLHIEPNYTLS